MFPSPVRGSVSEVELQYIFGIGKLCRIKSGKHEIVPQIKIDDIIVQKLIAVESAQVIVIDDFSFGTSRRIHK